MSIIIPSNFDYRKSQSTDWSFSDDVLPNASFFDLSISCGGSVVSSPIENGSFFSYNKTNEPIQINANLSFSGTNTFLQSVLDRLYKLKNSVTTFSIKTPIYEYRNMNLESFDYALRREDGLGVLYIKANFVEIREVQLTYTDTGISPEQTKDVAASSEVQGGLKQTSTPTTQQQEAGNVSMEMISDRINQVLSGIF